MAGYAGYDMAAAIVMILFAVLGLAGGLLRQIVRLAAVFLGGWAGLVWGPDVVSRLGISMGHSLTLLVPLLVFLVVYLVIVMVGAVILKIIKATSPAAGLIDRVLGLVLGALKGAVLVYMITAIVIFAAGNSRIRGMGTRRSMVYNWVHAHPITVQKVEEVEKTIRVKVIHALKTGKEAIQKEATTPQKDATQNKDEAKSSQKGDR